MVRMNSVCKILQKVSFTDRNHHLSKSDSHRVAWLKSRLHIIAFFPLFQGLTWAAVQAAGPLYAR